MNGGQGRARQIESGRQDKTRVKDSDEASSRLGLLEGVKGERRDGRRTEEKGMMVDGWDGG